MRTKENFKAGELVKKIFIAAGIAVGFGASLIMPGLPIGLKAILDSIEENKPSREQAKRVLRRLEKQKIVSIKEVDGDFLVTFTSKGEKLFLKYNLETLRIEKPRRWDRKWRMVVFDIPERKRLAREILREKLKDLGFVAIQKSVFIHPYECQREVELIKKVYEIEPYVYYIIAEFIDNQEKLIKRFSL